MKTKQNKEILIMAAVEQDHLRFEREYEEEEPMLTITPFTEQREEDFDDDEEVLMPLYF